MSESVAQPKGATKSTCRKCNRTVYVVMVGGQRIELDVEAMLCVQALDMGHSAEVIRARRMHSELCATYATQGKRRHQRWW